ncbi:MAG: ExbD/TolR family protein [Limisphaerales bacterium]
MRRFSQKNALVTLSDLNVTPLLDLAFVLLIIFAITTPLLEQSVQLELPRGGKPDDFRLERKDIQTVEVTATGELKLESRPIGLDQLEEALAAEFERNPRMVVDIRADGRTAWKAVSGILDRCQRRGITRIRPKMFPEN